MITVKKNEATAAYRRMYFHCVDATDGMTPETGEAGGQPQVSVNGDAFGTQAIIGVLVAIGNGRYYAELTQAGVNIADRSVIEGRYKSANTAEAVGTTMQIIEYPIDASVNGVLTESESHPTLAEIEASVILAKEATLATIAGYIDTEITTIINAIAALQTDLGDPSVDATTIYAQALLIKGYVDDLETRLTATRAGYLDNLSGGAVALNSTVAKEATLALVQDAVYAGKWVIDPTGKTLTLYKADGVTVLKIIDLTSTTATIPTFIQGVPRA